MANQKILFTVMPSGVTLGSGRLRVSVYVSPRLMGADRLKEFPDWLFWTPRLKDNGLSLTFSCGPRQMTLPVETAPLRSELWLAMFNEQTFVRSHKFDDYSDRAILSWPVRFALSTIKSIYQQAGVELALPDRTPPIRGEQEVSHHRRLIRDLVAGFAVNWDEKRGGSLRDYYRDTFASPLAAFFPSQYQAADLGPDGLLKTMPPGAANKFFRQRMTEQFAVCNHVPPGKPIDENPPDFDTLIDFHQALSSLNSYPELLRALGLVFDFDLPPDFLTPAAGFVGTLSISGVPNVAWQLDATETVPALPLLETAYVLVPNIAQNTYLFATAPGALGQLSDQIETFGLLNTMPGRYGLAQVDVDGALHKAIMLSETWQDGKLHPTIADHPEVFDESATLPALRSGGLSLFADGRAMKLLARFKQSKMFDDALAANTPMKRPFYAEDLIHGYRLDIWDSHTNAWHSLHLRDAIYRIGEETFSTEGEEGFTQLAATQAAPDPDNPPPNDLYLHEAVARWAGWSLSVPMVGKHLSSDPDPDKALDNPDENAPATPFKMTTEFHVAKGTLPSLRFGRRYRLRARVVDICGNSLGVDNPLAGGLANLGYSIPADPTGFPYLRYEPVAAPIVVVRDSRAITGAGSSIDRLVIRTYNSAPSLDSAAADLTANDRHLVPPRTSVDTAEKLSMFDDAVGKLASSAAMYNLIAARDKGELNQLEMEIAGHTQKFPHEPAAQIDPLPYLPDVLARGVALRDLPGTENGTLGLVDAGTLQFHSLNDPNPRPGSATLIGFGGSEDWQKMLPLRLALGETGAGHSAPEWNHADRVLTVFVPKGKQTVVPLSSYVMPDDLKLMGVWQWIREHIDVMSTQQPDTDFLTVGEDVDKIAYVLQRSVEGGHWMINPPRLLTLVHAVQQPIGIPEFCAISVQHQPYGDLTQYPYDETRNPSSAVLQTTPEKKPTAETELAAVTAWRKPGAVDAYLMGGLRVHGASTEKVDILAEWIDPIDDVGQLRVAADPNSESHGALVDEVPIRTLSEGIITVKEGSVNQRAVAYFDHDHDLLCFVRGGDSLGNLLSPDLSLGSKIIHLDAAPRHHLNDTRHHRISYRAVVTSRFRDYFAADEEGGFIRISPSIMVDVPASARPNAPQIAYVVPTFGWQRQTETNLKRSVRFGGGLRVYLERPWFSSGEGELLGVSLYVLEPGKPIDSDAWKCFVTQWGGDPIWQTDGLFLTVPQLQNFDGHVALEEGVSLEAPAPEPGRVHVVGYPVAFDEASQLWYADLTINTNSSTYAPFVRLALSRYQPHAIPNAKLSRVVIADFAQLTSSRAATVTVNPYHPRRLRVTVSGIAPTGPAPAIYGTQPDKPATQPTVVSVTVQERRAGISGDLGWQEAAPSTAIITDQTSTAPSLPELVRWTGTVDFPQTAEAGRYRLLIREHEYLSANYLAVDQPGSAGSRHPDNPGRLIYAEVVDIDAALIGGPSVPTATSVDDN
jgi:hypothetical protein